MWEPGACRMSCCRFHGLRRRCVDPKCSPQDIAQAKEIVAKMQLELTTYIVEHWTLVILACCSSLLYLLYGGQFMAIFYRGAGRGTHWHTNDARNSASGFQPIQSGITSTVDRIIRHIARGDTNSPYVSITSSFAIAYFYAMYCGKQRPDRSNHAFVYEIEIRDLVGASFRMIDPVVELSNVVPNLPDPPRHHHEGNFQLLHGVIGWHWLYRRHRNQNILLPPNPPNSGRPSTGTSVNVLPELHAAGRALRDAEILIYGGLPSAYIIAKHAVW